MIACIKKDRGGKTAMVLCISRTGSLYSNTEVINKLKYRVSVDEIISYIVNVYPDENVHIVIHQLKHFRNYGAAGVVFSGSTI